MKKEKKKKKEDRAGLIMRRGKNSAAILRGQIKKPRADRTPARRKKKKKKRQTRDPPAKRQGEGKRTKMLEVTTSAVGEKGGSMTRKSVWVSEKRNDTAVSTAVLGEEKKGNKRPAI